MTAPDTIWQQQIIREVSDPNTTMSVVVAALWNAFSDKGRLDSQLQILYTKRGAIDARLAEEFDAFDFQSDQDRFTRSQRFDHLQQMRTDVSAEIIRVEGLVRARRAPAYGAISATTPMSPPFADDANANDPIYRGSPYGRRGEVVI